MKNITLTATQEDFDKSLPGFLHEHPLPVDDEGEPTITVAEHIKEYLKGQYFKEANHGTMKLAGEAARLTKVFD